MAEPWTFVDAAPAHTGVTVVNGASFCVSESNGDVIPVGPHGLFFLDTRFVSHWVLRVNGAPVRSLAVDMMDSATARFVGRASRLNPDGADDPVGSIVVIRQRRVQVGMVETITLTNHGMTPTDVEIDLEVGADHAGLFQVKEQRVPAEEPAEPHWQGSSLWVRSSGSGRLSRATEVTARPPAEPAAGGMRWSFRLEPRQSVSVRIVVRGWLGDRMVSPNGDGPEVDTTAEWRARVPRIATDCEPLSRALARTSSDLGALRLVDPDHPEDVLVAAGAPWFMTLFGRDSLLTAYMALPVDRTIALGVVRTLARLQGRRFVPETEEEPGRILHEIRMDTTPSSSLADGTVYYGTVDATPLFVVLLGELRRWGLERDAVAELLPAADRALEWIVDIGDRDGDGYVEYQRATPAGLANQGWKDSWDAIRFADGTLAEGPIALCEVQAYCYAAFLARAHFADEDGDDDLAAHWRDRAARLRDAFRRDFWIDDGGYVALALDGDKRPVDAVASNMGHCLWAGILDPLHAAQVARHLMSAAMFSGWGIRTLSTEMAAYDPLSYHNGSVWPHDNALIAAGLVRYGHTEAAHRVMHALLEVSTHLDGRMPELFSGLSRDELGVPVPYPSSCIPQAWSAASPLLMLRSLLRLDPWYSHDAVWVAPELPSWIGRLRVEGIPYANDLISVEVDGGRVHIEGLSPDVHLIRAPRVALGDLGGRA